MKIVHKKNKFTRPEQEGTLIADEEKKFNDWKEKNGKLQEENNVDPTKEDSTINPDTSNDNLENQTLDGTKPEDQPVNTGTDNSTVSPEQVQLPQDNSQTSETTSETSEETPTTAEAGAGTPSTETPSSENGSKKEETSLESLKELVLGLANKIDTLDSKMAANTKSTEGGEGTEKPENSENASTTTSEVAPETTSETNSETTSEVAPETAPETTSEVTPEAVPEKSAETPATTSENPEQSEDNLDAAGEEVNKEIPQTEMFKAFCKKDQKLNEDSNFIIGKLIRSKAYKLEEKILSIVDGKIKAAIEEQKKQIRIENNKK